MQTVPVTLVNGSCRIKVNALLDDASTKTYINTDVAAELGLQGSFQKTNVNVLNGQVETFLTMPVALELESLNGTLVDILISLDYADLHYSMQDVRGQPNESIA